VGDESGGQKNYDLHDLTHWWEASALTTAPTLLPYGVGDESGGQKNYDLHDLIVWQTLEL